MPRKPRPGEHVCRCYAYKFPHRFGGGLCRGHNLVADQWLYHFGGGACADCHSNSGGTCEVFDGRERVSECPVWQDHVRDFEIKLLGPYWAGTRIS